MTDDEPLTKHRAHLHQGGLVNARRYVTVTWLWEPNWISYRGSLARIDRRADDGDLAVTCIGCGCEADVDPVPHSPKCAELLA